MPEATRKIYKKAFQFFYHRYDVFGCFIEQSLNLLAYSGILTFIQPSVFLNSQSFMYCREHLVKNCSLLRLNLLKDGIFDSAVVPTMIMSVAQKEPINQSIVCSQGLLRDYYTIEQKSLQKTDAYVFNLNLDSRTAEFIERTQQDCLMLGEIARVSNGINTGNLSAYIHEGKHQNTIQVLKGGSISKWKYQFNDLYLDNCFDEFVSCGDLDSMKGEKLMMKRIGIYPNVCYDKSGIACLHTIHTIRITDKQFSAKYVMALLNSKLLGIVFRQRVPLKGDVFPEFRVFDLNQQIPIHKASTEQQKAIASVVDEILETSDAEVIRKKEVVLDNMILDLYGIRPEELDYFVAESSKE